MAVNARNETADRGGPTGPAAGMAQRRRWVVFGSNVAVAVLLATVLVGVVVWLSGTLLRGRVRGDWTATGRFSLSPRTKALLKEIDADPRHLEVRLTNLYSHTPEIPASEDQWRRVQDLLSEYAMASARVEVEAINPAVDVGGVENLVRRLTERYAGQLRKPKRLIEEFKALDKDVRQTLQTEARRLAEAADGWKDGPPEALETLRMVSQVWGQLQVIGALAAENVRVLTEQALPAYSDALDQAKDYLRQVRERFAVVPQALAKVKEQAGEAKVPEAVARLIAEAEKTYGPLRERIEAFEKKVEEAGGEKELDTVRRQIGQGETILIETFADRGVLLVKETDADKLREAVREAAGGDVLVQPPGKGEGSEVLVPPERLEAARKALEAAGFEVVKAEVAHRPDRIHVVGFDDVWVHNPNAGEDPEAPERLFAGEQAVSSALLGLVHRRKPALLFVTAGGPATEPMPSPMGAPQPPRYRQMAERLEKANFIVRDWNVQTQREMPEIPEASKVVLVLVPPAPPNPRLPMPPPSPETYQPAVDLVKQGAPAVVLGEPAGLFQQAVPYADLFGEFGVEAKFGAVAVRQVVVDASGKTEALPQVQITQYPAHEITDPLGALPTMVLTGSPLQIKTDLPEGLSVAPILELPAGRDYWADTVVIEALNRQATFDPAEDLTGPLPLAVAVTRQVGGETQKVVLFGDADLPRDGVAFYRNPVLYRDRIEMQYAFPGNAELFVNACLWVAGSEQLIAVSPEALEARRLGDMGGWQLPLQILIIGGLPALVLAVGVVVYLVRRG